ncbi:hypothetical protein KUCAC02_007502, partial [Chaenocephalus aceratus]
NLRELALEVFGIGRRHRPTRRSTTAETTAPSPGLTSQSQGTGELARHLSSAPLVMLARAHCWERHSKSEVSKLTQEGRRSQSRKGSCWRTGDDEHAQCMEKGPCGGFSAPTLPLQSDTSTNALCDLCPLISVTM